MLSIFRKEINVFFSSLIGYIVLMVFLVGIGLFVWIFPETNVLDYGYSALDTLFYAAPWVFMFLIPAITMRSFSEEIGSGTIELLATRPLTDLDIILGKYFAALVLVVFSVLPTFVYFYSVYQLGSPVGNIDTGATWGSYIGLIFLGGTFVSIGIFASSLTRNQIVAFILAVFLCFIFYIAFESLSSLDIFYAKIDDIVEMLGINYHYQSISRGVVDTRDVIYFISLITLFIYLTKVSLESRKWN
jgi:ABC-2 type transport system permease protein